MVATDRAGDGATGNSQLSGDVGLFDAFGNQHGFDFSIQSETPGGVAMEQCEYYVPNGVRAESNETTNRMLHGATDRVMVCNHPDRDQKKPKTLFPKFPCKGDVDQCDLD